MQVFGLPGRITRNGKAASGSRWRPHRRTGGQAVGVARGQSRSPGKKVPAVKPARRRPHVSRRPALVIAVEKLRSGKPMWGKRELTVLLRRQGVAASVSTLELLRIKPCREIVIIRLLGFSGRVLLFYRWRRHWRNRCLRR
jgi:hypothetical protein